MNTLPDELVLKIFRFCSISNRGPIFTYCLDPPHPKLEISAQLLRVSKHFRDLGREILYGENRFYFDNFEQLDTWTTKIGAGAMAELRVIELTFNNDNNIYSARDFERYSKLKHLTVWLVDNSVFSDSELILHNLRRAQFPTRNPPLTFQDVLTRYPLPPKLQNGERVSSPARRLMPKTLPFFADCVLDLVRMDRLRIHAKIRQMRPDLSFASGDNWTQIREEFYNVILVPKDAHIKSSLLFRNYDLQLFHHHYYYPPATNGC